MHIATAVLLAVLGAAQVSSAAEAKGLRFAWPVPCRGSVVEISEKKGKKNIIRYNVVLERRPAGDGLDLRIEDVEFREVLGIDLTKEENRKRFAPLLAQMLPLLAAMPRLRLSLEGKVEDVVGMEEAADSAIAVIRKTSGEIQPQMAESIAKALRSPAMIAQMKQKATDFWGIWVGAWVGVDLEPGKEMPSEQEIPFPDGSKVKAQARIRREPDPAGEDGRVALSMTSNLSGEEARKAFGRMMEELMGKIPPPKDSRVFSADQVEEFSRSMKSSVVTDPRTLRPSRSSLEAVSTVAIKGQGRRIEVERHEYVFEWSAASEKTPK